ncbi:HHL151Wp [Eremothecium sinecaudum]|uniref:HHL151Wp n=1 Tax=Eremothecium sinecaudum TaxID=45286 RepID=A0A0X8HW49_9SACH|nr:HHL151Wp [Eremothecium sinecaudum]AMD22619.1 HHL151Wp [Eremothecium sinecaudum]
MLSNEDENGVLFAQWLGTQPQEDPFCYQPYSGPFPSFPWTENLVLDTGSAGSASQSDEDTEFYSNFVIPPFTQYTQQQPNQQPQQQKQQQQLEREPVSRRPRQRSPLNDRTCPICHKVFTRKVSVKVHMVVHVNTKPYACDYPGCKKKFNVKGNLQRHSKCHRPNNDTTRKKGVANPRTNNAATTASAQQYLSACPESIQ